MSEQPDRYVVPRPTQITRMVVEGRADAYKGCPYVSETQSLDDDKLYAAIREFSGHQVRVTVELLPEAGSPPTAETVPLP